MESTKSLLTKEHRSRIVDAIMQGQSTSDIIDLVKIYSPVPLSEREVKSKINDARMHLSEMAEMGSQKIVAVHLCWYEQMFQYFHEIQHVEGMNRVMKAKERLLGLHRREEKIVINNKNTINVARKVEYDFSKLSEPQKTRLQELMDKMK